MSCIKLILTLVFASVVSTSFAQSSKKVNGNAKQLLTTFLKKAKFDAEPGSSFNGISNPKLKATLTALIKQAAQDFLLTLNQNPTEDRFQFNIKSGLARFDKLELDTEDKERVCRYFEELMDCVGLQSSNGQLNQWLYGFDTTNKG